MTTTTRLPLLALTLVLAGGCYASTGTDDVGDPIAEPLVDECVATAFAWSDAEREPAAEPGTVVVFANYPLASPSYELELYGMELVVEIDERFDARYATTDWGAEGIEDVVFGRAAGEPWWRVLADPDAVCPPRPAGVEWPTDI